MATPVISLDTAMKLRPKMARQRRKRATYKLRPALERVVREFLHKTFGRKNAGLRHLERRIVGGDMETPDGTYLGEAVGEVWEAAIDRRYQHELIDVDAQPRRRGRPKGSPAFKPLSSRTDKEFIDAILAACLQTWVFREREPPSELTVAEAIAARLGVADESRYAVGSDLLDLAYSAGIVAPIYRPRGKVGKTQKYEACVRLTDELAAALCDLEGDESWPWPATGLHESEITGRIDTTGGSEQSEAPYEPRVGTAPLVAAERIRATHWRPNAEMLVAGEDWLQRRIDETAGETQEDSFGGPPIEKWNARRAAEEYKAEIAAYWALKRSPVKRGQLAVRFEHRGRVNQVDSMVTYTSGCEIARGVLEFDTPRRVETLEGMQALARHALNQWDGTESRRVPRGSELDWFDTHREIEWERAKHPLRFLAAVRALNAAQNDESIRLPVSIDATTSVLQHMALLLRDPQLAKLSNLWPSEVQRDFYSEVVEVAGLQAMLPPDLKGKARDIVKPIVMPTFYGKSKWKSLYDLACRKVPKEMREPAYKAMMRAARDLAPRAFELYEAMRGVALELAERGESVAWTTPSGWQGCTAKRVQIDGPASIDRTLPSGKRIQRRPRVNGPKLDPDAQANAITANLIHSLDATLLHLAVRGLPEAVTSIGVAHDCFATHADDVPVLRATLMRALDQMYAERDLLADWWTVWKVNVPCPERRPWDPRFLQGDYAFC